MANKEDANVHRVSSKHNNYYFLLQNTIFPLFLELPQILYYVFHIFCGCSKRSGKNWSNSVCATIFVAAPKKWQKSAYGVYATIIEATQKIVGKIDPTLYVPQFLWLLQKKWQKLRL